MIIILITILSSVNTICRNTQLTDPIVRKDGDFLIVGLFDLSARILTNVVIGNLTEKGWECSMIKSGDMYKVQRALAFVWTMENILSRSMGNYTLGYEVYQVCGSKDLSRRIATKLTYNDKIIGAIAPGSRPLVEPIIGMLSSTLIPTMSYIYSEELLLNHLNYPNYLSLIETEQMEAESMIRILKEFDYQFIDIWYHDYSLTMANYIHENYVKKVGCGRINRYHKQYASNQNMKDVLELTRMLDRVYINDTNRAASVHLLLFNNFISTKIFLDGVTKRGPKWQNNVYIFGYTNGRHKYRSHYLEILTENMKDTESDDLLIFLQSDLLNNPVPKITRRFYGTRSNNGLFDKLLSIRRKQSCIRRTQGVCPMEASSWLPFLVLGAEIFANAFRNISLSSDLKNDVCIQSIRSKIYNSITKGRGYSLNVGDLLLDDLDVSFDRSTLSSGYTVEVFRRSYNTRRVRILGKVSFTHSKLNTEIINTMRPTEVQRVCSLDCGPGFRRDFMKSLNLTCCWECKECQGHTFSDKTNSDDCRLCGEREKVVNNFTGCTPVDKVYIKYNSVYFIVGCGFFVLGVGLTIGTLVYVVRREDRPIIKASDPTFCYILLFSFFLGYIASLASLAEPSNFNCKVEYILAVLFSSLVSSTLALRCVKMYTLFTSMKNFSSSKLGKIFTPNGQILTNAVMIIFNITVAIILLHFDVYGFKSHQEENHTTIYHTCYSYLDYITPLPFLTSISLFTIALVLAFKMRKFPHNFRETNNIFLATLVVLVTCVMFLTGYVFCRFDIRALLRSIVMYITSLSFLSSIFGPKIAQLIKNMDDEREKITLSVKTFSEKTAAKRMSHIREKKEKRQK